MADMNLQMQIDARRNNNESSTKFGRKMTFPFAFRSLVG